MKAYKEPAGSGGPSKEPTAKKLPLGDRSATKAAPISSMNPMPSSHLKGEAQERKVNSVPGQPLRPGLLENDRASGAAQPGPFQGGMAPGKRYRTIDDRRNQ